MLKYLKPISFNPVKKLVSNRVNRANPVKSLRSYGAGKKIILLCLGFVIAFNLIGYLTVRAGSTAVQFTADTIISLSGIDDGDLYVRTNSECAEISVSGTNLTITDIPDANNFILKTTHNNALKLTPSGGVLDLTLDSGNISSNNITQWTLNASSGTTVSHIVGVSNANTWHAIKADDVLFNSFQSNSSGEVSFTYNGSWSEKVFTIEADATAPTNFSLVSPLNNSSTSESKPTFSWNACSDPDLSYYQLYIGNSLDTSNITTTSAAPANNLSCGNHTWYVKAVDNAGNTTNSGTFNLTMVCDTEEDAAAEDSSDDSDDDEDSTNPEDLEVSSVKSTATDTTITITWKTDHNAKGYVRYGTDKDLSQKKKEDKKKKKHQLTLKNLTPSTQYYFRITEETSDEAIDRSKIHAVATLPISSSSSMEKLDIKVQDYDESKKQEEDKKEQTEEDKIKEEKKSDRRSYEEESFTTKLFKENDQKYVETVKFQIVDNNNQPIPNLKVTLRSDPQTVQTDEQGLAVFQNVALGTHTLAFNYQNRNFKKKVAIGDDSDKEGIVQANVIIIKAVKDPLPWWVWGVIGCLVVAVVWLSAAYFRKRKKVV